MLVVVSGNIATGKTTLVSLLAKRYPSFHAHLEKPAENPYLDQLSASRDGMLGFQLFYLVQCIRGYEIAGKRGGSVFLERSFEENRMFGCKFLRGPELSLYRSICSLLQTSFVVPPDLVIYLEADLCTIERNLQRRSSPSTDTARIREYPRIMSPDYLEFKRTYVESHRHLIIDMDHIDFQEDPAAVEGIVRMIEQRIEEID